MAMLSDSDLFDAITLIALKGCDCDVGARRNALWRAATAILADCLRSQDLFTAERMLRSLPTELRDVMAQLDELLQPSSPYPKLH